MEAVHARDEEHESWMSRKRKRKKATDNNVKKNLGTHTFLNVFDACHDNPSGIVDV